MIDMNRIHVKIRGSAPLLQNRFDIGDHGAEASKAKKKNYIPEEEAERLCYRDQSGKLVHPGEHIFASLVSAGVDFKFSGRKSMKDVLKAGILVEPEYIPITNEGKVVEKYEIDIRRVVIQRASVAKWRPRYKEGWELEFFIDIIDEDNITPNNLKEIAERAGKFKGIGDYRPRFGRFDVVKWEPVPVK